jgi:hypothetical protein
VTGNNIGPQILDYLGSNGLGGILVPFADPSNQENIYISLKEVVWDGEQKP